MFVQNQIEAATKKTIGISKKIKMPDTNKPPGQFEICGQSELSKIICPKPVPADIY
jgi:hypothetical protein